MPIIEAIISNLSHNPYFGAGFGLLGVGAAGAVGKRAASLALSYARRKYIVSVEIPHTDPSYYWFLQWMSTKVKNTQQLAINTQISKYENGLIETRFSFHPSVGNHYFRYGRTWIKLERTRERGSGGGGGGGVNSNTGTITLPTGGMYETVSLKMLGRDKKVLFDLLHEARELSLKAEENKTIIYKSHGPEWRKFGPPRKKRDLSSVVLPIGIDKIVVQDIQDFLSSSKWYSDRGIPYRRGYLLYGSPGSGKSSFVQALAATFSYDICMLSLSELGLTDDRLHHLLINAPARSIILLEDVDACFVSRVKDLNPKHDYGAGYSPTVTFSGLLNALDGVVASEGRILIMTTNHVERLDPALIRPGRVDVKIPLGDADLQQVLKLFTNFYPETTELELNRFKEEFLQGASNEQTEVDNTTTDTTTTTTTASSLLTVTTPTPQRNIPKISMAAMTGYFLLYKINPNGAIDNVAKWLKEQQKYHK